MAVRGTYGADSVGSMLRCRFAIFDSAALTLLACVVLGRPRPLFVLALGCEVVEDLLLHGHVTVDVGPTCAGHIELRLGHLE